MRRRCSFWMPDHDHHLSLPTLRHSNIIINTNNKHWYSYALFFLREIFFCVDILHLDMLIHLLLIQIQSAGHNEIFKVASREIWKMDIWKPIQYRAL